MFISSACKNTKLNTSSNKEKAKLIRSNSFNSQKALNIVSHSHNLKLSFEKPVSRADKDKPGIEESKADKEESKDVVNDQSFGNEDARKR